MASPVVQSASEALGNSATPTITEPASAAQDDLLIAVVGSADAGTAITGLTGWTQLGEGDDGVGNRFWFGWIIRGASAPDLVAAAANANWVAMCVRVDGHDATTPIGTDHATATGTSVNPDAPNVDPGSSRDHLAVLGVVQEGKNDNRFTDSLPTGYTEQADIGTGGGGAGTGHVGGAMNSRAYTGQAENPSTHTSSRNDGWIAITMIVRPTAGTAHTETPTDDADVTDSTPIKQGKGLVEAVGIADVVSRIHDAVRSEDEAVGVADSIAVAKSIVVEISDPVGVVDSTEDSLTKAEVVTDPVGVTDSTSVKQGKAVVEPVGLTDTVSPAKSSPRSVSEAIGVTDSVLPAKTITVTVTEAVGAADTTTPVKSIGVEVSEPVGVSDVIARVVDFVRSVDEAVGLGDSTPIKQGKSIVDPVGVTDSTLDVISGDKVETVTEAVGVVDSVERVHDAVRSSTEPVGITDSVLPAKSITIEISEAVGLPDSTLPAKASTVEISEAVGAEDTTSRIVDYVRTVVEAVGVSDSTVRALDHVRSVDEAVGVSDDTVDDLVLAGAEWWLKDPVDATKDPVAFTKVPPGSTTPW